MLSFKITRQQMQHVNIFGCFRNFFRLLQIKWNLQIYKLFLPFDLYIMYIFIGAKVSHTSSKNAVQENPT